MKSLSIVLVLGLFACSTAPEKAHPPASPMQAIVDRTAAAHPEIARLSIHAVPAGESRMRIVASTVAGRVGEMSDPEDLEATKTGRPVQMQEGHNLDYTEAVQDRSGQTIAVVGVTISGTAGNASKESQLTMAKQIAAETAAAIRAPK